MKGVMDGEEGGRDEMGKGKYEKVVIENKQKAREKEERERRQL